MSFDAASVVAALSGLALATLGLLVLRVGARKLDQLAFAAFALLWGLQVFAANVAKMAADEATASLWVHAFVALLVPIYVPLVAFALAHVVPSPAVARRPTLLLLLALPALATLVVLAAAPDLFVQRVFIRPETGQSAAAFGPLLFPLAQLPFLLGFYAALLLSFRKYLAAPGAQQRARLGFVVAALLCYVAYVSALIVPLAVLDLRTLLSGATGPPLLLLGIAGLLLVAGIVVRVARQRDAPPLRDLVIAAAALPAVFGLLEGWLLATGRPVFETAGVWRLAAVALVAYGMAHYQLFDVQLRLKRLAPAASYALALGAAVVAVGWLAWGTPPPRPLPGGAMAMRGAGIEDLLGLLALVGAAIALAPVPRLTRRVLDRAAPWVRPETDYLYRRKVEVYRASLEEACQRGMSDDTEQAFLSHLRRRLGLTEREHRLLLLMVQAERGRPETAPRGPAGQRFHVERELGRGTFGRALLAQDTRLDRKVVLKQPLAPWLLDAEGRKLFLQEAKLGARLQHPNVVTVYEVLPDEEPPMLVLEYVQGGSLADRLERGPMAAGEAVRVALDVLAGLEAIHEAGIVHRDLKPANILFDARGRAKITDFGIAHPPKELARSLTLAQSGQPGSLAYMSPEQARGDPVDARSDLYAVGVLLYAALTGQHYLGLRGQSEFRARQLIQEAEPRLPAPEVPKPVEDVLRKALAKDPAQRFLSAEAMARAL